ncbi:hypothetical protein [Blattabacterium cuenoti]|nr:hypothetical protein [Blattabacterium cuenoti]
MKNEILFFSLGASSKMFNTGDIDIIDITENKECIKLHIMLII